MKEQHRGRNPIAFSHVSVNNEYESKKRSKVFERKIKRIFGWISSLFKKGFTTLNVVKS